MHAPLWEASRPVRRKTRISLRAGAERIRENPLLAGASQPFFAGGAPLAAKAHRSHTIRLRGENNSCGQCAHSGKNACFGAFFCFLFTIIPLPLTAFVVIL